LALVDTSALPAAWHKSMTGWWAVTRTAMVSRPPVSSAGKPGAARTIGWVGGPVNQWVELGAVGSDDDEAFFTASALERDELLQGSLVEWVTA
jgi:hypothetical protein